MKILAVMLMAPLSNLFSLKFRLLSNCHYFCKSFVIINKEDYSNHILFIDIVIGAFRFLTSWPPWVQHEVLSNLIKTVWTFVECSALQTTDILCIVIFFYYLFEIIVAGICLAMFLVFQITFKYEYLLWYAWLVIIVEPWLTVTFSTKAWSER